MSNTEKIQLLVIGAGPGGYTAALLAADKGLNVTLVDLSENLGGICLQKGCIPSKALLHAAKTITESKEASEYGISFLVPSIDIDKLRKFKNNTIKKLCTGLAQLCKARNIDFIQGKALFTSSSSVNIEKPDGATVGIEFDKAIIATGSVPSQIPGVGFSSKIMDSTEALKIESIPKSLLVVGGGYIGLELGSVYSALGSEVSLSEMTSSLLPGVDDDLARTLGRKLKKTFKEIILDKKVSDIKETDINISVKIGESEKEYEKILIAIGRKPCLDILHVENTSIELDENGFVKVDARRQTTDKNIFAIGDISGQPMLAHKASSEAKVAVDNIIGKNSEFNPKAIPAVVFTDPEIAWCGLTENEAKQKGIDIEVTKFPWMASGKALSMNRPNGMTKLIIDPKTETILGMGIVGESAGELIAEGVVAIEMGAKASDLKRCIHPHPTLSETIMETAEMFYGESPSIYKLKKD